METSIFLSELKKLKNFRNIEISSIHLDSREVKQGSIFFAIKGNKLNGNDFISVALDRGASLVVSDTDHKDQPNVIYFRELKQYIGIFASRFFGNPSKILKTVCVTGTNGKTTSVETFASMCNLLGYRCAYMSTINFSRDGSCLEESNLTTPDPIKINKNEEVAHILLNYPDGLHWKEICKIGNKSYTKNKWDLERIVGDSSLSMTSNPHIYLIDKGKHRLIKYLLLGVEDKDQLISLTIDLLNDLNLDM